VLFGSLTQFLIRCDFMWATCLRHKIYTASVLHYHPIIHVNTFLSPTVLHFTSKSSVFLLILSFLQDNRAEIKQSLESLNKKRNICFFVTCVLSFILNKLQVFWACFCVALPLMWSFTTAQSLDLTIFFSRFFCCFRGVYAVQISGALCPFY